MGFYPGKRENPCPRCGGTVWTMFISVGAMSYDQQCEGCATETYTEAEERALGANVPREAAEQEALGLRTTHGMWEADPDVRPTTRVVSWDLPWPFPRQHQQEISRPERRAVYETWIEDGKTYGRWDYERRVRWESGTTDAPIAVQDRT